LTVVLAAWPQRCALRLWLSRSTAKEEGMATTYAWNQFGAPGWFGFPRPNPAARLRLLCFPYAGAGADIFYEWPAQLPETVELCLVHLPGRGHRLKEKPLARMSHLMQALERPLLPYLDKPLAIFGHSMGALIGFELSRHLRRQFGLEPAHLFISGCQAPVVGQRRMPISDLPLAGSGRWQEIKGLTGAVLNDTGLLRLMLPTVEADLSLCETYTYTDEELLDCPISAYGGLQDRQVKPENLEAWRKETTAQFRLHLFRGEHFFLHTAQPLVLDALSGELNSLADRLD